MGREGNVNRIGALLGNLVGEKQWRERLDMHALFLSWAAMVGEDIAAVAQPEVIREQVLWVRVADPVWHQQLVFQKTALLAEINRHLRSKEKIADLRFRLDGSLEREEAGRVAEQRAAEAAKGPGEELPLDPAREAEFTRMVSVIDDPEARANLLRLWRKSVSRPHS